MNSGLETNLYALLTAAGFLALVRGLESERFAPGPGLALFLAATLTRFDGFAPFGLAIAAAAVAGWRRGERKTALVSIFAVVAVYAAYLGWRFYYYGSILPNTAIAKVNAAYPAGMRLAAGWEYLRDGILGMHLYLLIPGFLLFLWLDRKRTIAWFAAALVGWYGAKSVLVGGEAMPGFRFLVGGLPLLTAGAAAGYGRLREVTARLSGPAVAATALAAFAVGAQWMRPVTTVGEVEMARARGNARLVVGYTEIARGFENICTGKTELATDVAGLFAFYTDCLVLDTWGLNSREITRRGRAFDPNRFTTFGVVAPEVVLERRSEMILPYPPVPMPEAKSREEAIRDIFPAPFFVNRKGMDAYGRAVLETANGRYAYLVRDAAVSP
ncbi:MAG: hypothetical protein M5R36_25020 [Deltaproteobacteria bacterium]|nr:hypothetical protein [Deltaproteobacteria bacterium]